MTQDYKPVPITEAVVDYVLRGSFCRDCADADGVCPNSGLPCDERAKQAVRYVLARLHYGIVNGFLKP